MKFMKIIENYKIKVAFTQISHLENNPILWLCKRFYAQTCYCSYARPTQPGPIRTRLCGPCIAAIAGD